MQLATDAELAVYNDDAVEDIDDDAVEPDVGDTDGDVAQPAKKPISAPWRAMLLGLAVVVALAGLVGWFGLRVNHSHQAQAQRNLFLQVAKRLSHCDAADLEHGAKLVLGWHLPMRRISPVKDAGAQHFL